MATHVHVWKETGNDLICTECGSRKLKLVASPQEGLLTGTMKNGRVYSVRKHRKAYLFPDMYEKMYENLASETAKRTCDILVQTGARINEARNVQYRDFDFGRNTLRFRIAKSKARKVGEERGNPRTIPISNDFTKKMKKFFSGNDMNESINILSTSAFDVSMKKALQKSGCQEWYMFSAHSLRKTHGNWLKILGNYGIMKIDAAEICLRLGHDMNTFLKDYGSSGVMNPEDMVRARRILGDLYSSSAW